MANAEREGNWQRVAEIQHGELPALETAASESGAPDFQLIKTAIGGNEIAEVVAQATGIPVANLMHDERQKLLEMGAALRTRVVGQAAAVDSVSNAIRRARAGLSDASRPLGSFLFLGPTGVGKTELCKALADFLFDSERFLIRFDMSEYMEMHSVARLIGAPPGYVGYDSGGQLTEAVRRQPFSVILLDEVEKAHPNVLNVLLQVLDDGRITDGRGRTVDFKNTVIIMTSNLAAERIQEAAIAGRLTEDATAIIGEVRRFFRPEFFNRIDDCLVFQPLSAENMRQIVDLQLASLEARVEKQGFLLEVGDDLKEELATEGFIPELGARPLRRLIQHRIEDPLAEWLLANTPAAATSFKSTKTEASRRSVRFDDPILNPVALKKPLKSVHRRPQIAETGKDDMAIRPVLALAGITAHVNLTETAGDLPQSVGEKTFPARNPQNPLPLNLALRQLRDGGGRHQIKNPRHTGTNKNIADTKSRRAGKIALHDHRLRRHQSHPPPGRRKRHIVQGIKLAELGDGGRILNTLLPKAIATDSLVMSSCVEPMPPLVKT